MHSTASTQCIHTYTYAYLCAHSVFTYDKSQKFLDITFSFINNDLPIDIVNVSEQINFDQINLKIGLKMSGD